MCDALQRRYPKARVERDPIFVRDGKISASRAREVYRVEVSADGVIDAGKTAELRSQFQASKGVE